MADRRRYIARRLLLLSGWKVRGAVSGNHEKLIVLVAPIRRPRDAWWALLMAHAHPRPVRCFLTESSMPRVLRGHTTIAQYLRRSLGVERMEQQTEKEKPTAWDVYFMPLKRGEEEEVLIDQLCVASRLTSIPISLHTFDANRRLINVHSPFNPSGFPDRDKHYIVRQYEYY